MPPPRKKRTVTVTSSSDHEEPEFVNGIGKLIIEPPKKPEPKPRKPKANDDPDAPKKPRGRPRKSAQNDDDAAAPKPRRKRKSIVEDEEGSPPEKRKRKPRKSVEAEDDYGSSDDKPSKKSKLKIHEPTYNLQQDTYLTQLPREESPPWAIRPARWQKQDPPPPPKPMFQNFNPLPKAYPPPPPPPPRQTSFPPVSRPGPVQTKSTRPPSSPPDPFEASSPNSLYDLSPKVRPAGQSKSPQFRVPIRAASVVNSGSKVSPKRPEPAPDPTPVPAECPSSPPNIPKQSEFDDDFGSAIFDDFDEERDIPQATKQMPPPTLPTRTARNPTQQVPQGRPEDAHDIEAELADLPSDAFSDSGFSFPDEVQEQETAPAQAIEITSSQIASQTALEIAPRRLVAPLNGLRQTTLFGREAPVPQSQANKRYSYAREEPPTHHELDEEALQTWVYPMNIGTIRDYQYNIVHRGLFHNLLVALPTGLGKTFIAATVMLNWLRWTKKSQVLFVAPTKPLVSQQVEACLNIAGIPRSQTTLLTGDTPPALRQQEWETKRVFFMTPQTVVNDLAKGIADPKRIVLVIFDEAHRATGGYAYVEIVKFIRRFNTSFRILALTATPGATVEAVQKVIDSLEISKVEIRTENSLDIRQFVHLRNVEKRVLRDNRDILVCTDLFSKAVQPVLDKLNQQNAYWSRDPMKLSLYGLTQARSEWSRSQAGRNATGPVRGMVNTLFMTLTSLARPVDLLKYHGIRPFYVLLKDFKNDATTKTKKQVTDHPSFVKLMDTLRNWTDDREYIGHPKLEFLRERVLNHFLDAGEGTDASGSKTRIMVFAHWRDSAEDIVRVLKLSSPMIRPHVFVGQAAAKNSEAMDQKKQLEVVQKFKAGEYNTLVATSIGEEGLDIGEVDLIVCYDSKASPIRMLQRMGRTGRKRQGNILLLMMAGKEEDDSEKAKDAYNKMQEKIANGDEFNFHTDLARRIVPRGLDPKVDKKEVEIPIENSQPDLPEPKRGGRAPKKQPKKFHMPDGVMDGFVKASTMKGGDVDELGNTRVKARKTKKPAYVDPTEERVSANQVYLSQQEEKNLERQYQNVHDEDGDLEIPPLDLGAHPASQRVLLPTKYVPSSRASLAFVGTMNAIHDADHLRIEAFKRNYHASNFDGWRSADEDSEVEVVNGGDYEDPATPARSRNRISDMVMEADESSPPPTDPRMRIATQGINLGTQHTDGFDEPEDEQLDSELLSFIADDNEEVQVFSSSLPGRPRKPVKLFSDSQDYDDDPRHNQHGYANEDDEEDDLPDIGALLKKPGHRISRGQATAKVAASSSDSEDDEVVRQPQRRRLVVEDSETD